MTTEPTIENIEQLSQGKYKSVSDLPYRQGVIGIIQNDNNEYLIVQMVSYGENQWRFPGGGVDEGETHKEALLRELKEELNCERFEVLAESTHINKYDWPESVILDQIKNKNRYFRGQEQKQFLVKFTGKDSDIIVDPVELRQIKWVPFSELEKHFVFENQWNLSKVVLEEFGAK
jgi:putative (di)nucleoside polyphosphate hydrolase